MDGTFDADTLAGTAWQAERFGPDLANTPPADAEFTLEFEAARLSGSSGCNRFMGTWSVVDGTLEIGPLASTMMYCDGLMELESAYLSALQAVTGASLEADRLVLVGPDGAPAVELRTAVSEDRPAD